ncbi:YdiU family protein [Acetobacteraceae bacterium KSS8]|uniref:Protein nucleotidyltransferase YdiU n=1 Tax=Endosaccharibacter trunci TaxID=2812733 RepID=A0ABT1W8A8_9PROT|nr:YdiU family protein [Acetobacteraceae bacterium KSS8]
MATTSGFRPSTAHAALGALFFDPVRPAAFPQHILRFRNQEAARQVGLDGLSDADWIRHFGQFDPLQGSFEQPLALRYHGHQFRSYNPELGDGRGFLFAQAHDLRDGRLLDFGTKGSGTTPWSRSGDGRLTLKGGVREVLATTLLEALGVATSRSFSLIETGEQLVRNDEPSPTRSSVLVRLSHSHIRIGTFQRLAYLGETEAIRRLIDHAVAHYLPKAAREVEAERVPAFLDAVCARVAATGAHWMAAGFVHGVLNTDNINITGESFDYGPWRFLPVYDPGFTAAYFDSSGLYAFGRQPDTLLWNLARLAECLLPFAEQEVLEAVLLRFGATFHEALSRAMLWRLGRGSAGADADRALTRQVWEALRDSGAGFERFFFDWFATVPAGYAGEACDALRDRLSAHPITGTRDDAYFAGGAPCTLLIDEVERIWGAIADGDDWSVFERKLEAIGAMGRALRGAVSHA